MSAASAIRERPFDDVDVGLLVVAAFLHGPVDILTTLSAPGLESNPVVLALGWDLWLVFKVAFVIAFATSWGILVVDDRTVDVARIGSAVVLALGVAFVVPGVAIVVGGVAL